MRELRFESLQPDDEYIVLRDDAGETYRVPIDEALRLAVRRDRPQLEAYRASERSAVSPKEIQARIRAGATVAEVAHAGGVSEDAVRRFEGPVQAERSWIAQQTQAFTLGRDLGAPTLGDLVVDRLAARGVAEPPTWDAVRSGGEPWEVIARFTAADEPREARWRVDLVARTLVALDDESRWLSETELPTRHHPYDVEGGRSTPAPQRGTRPQGAITDTLLDDLAGRRGRPRPAAAAPAEEDTVSAASPESPAADSAAEDSASPVDAEPSEDVPQQTAAEESARSPLDDALFPAAPVLHLRTPREDPEPESPDAPAQDAEAEQPEEAEQSAAQAEEAAPSGRGRVRPRSRRTSVPSWDEIVFGARSEER